jgi:hypothetical protein
MNARLMRKLGIFAAALLALAALFYILYEFTHTLSEVTSRESALLIFLALFGAGSTLIGTMMAWSFVYLGKPKAQR